MTALPRGWAEARLDEIAEVRLGRQRSPKNHTGRRMKPYLRAANVTWNGLDLSDVKEMNFSEAESAIYELREGDIVLAEASGSASEVGKPALWRGEIPRCCFQNTLIRVRAKHVEPRYLLHYFSAEARAGRIGDASKGVGIHHIGSQRLAAWVLPIPPLAEQRRIVAAIEEQFSRLDVADVAISHARARLDTIRSATVNGALGSDWPEVPWKEVGLSQNGRAFPSRDYSTDGLRLLRPGNLHVSGRIVWTTKNTRKLPERYGAEFPGHVIGPNELVMNLTAQSLKDEFLGRVCLTGAGEQCLLNQRIARLTPHEADPRYLLWVFKGRRFRQFVNSLNTGSLIQHMFTSQLDEFPVPLPPLDVQHRIVTEIESRVSVVDAMREAIDTVERRSAYLRRAILERAFRGELVLQDPDDEPVSASTGRISSERTQSTPRRRISRARKPQPTR